MAVTAREVSASLQEVATAIGNDLEGRFGERLGFILLVWAGGEVSYVGTDQDRRRTAVALREFLRKWEDEGQDKTPAHKRGGTQ